jgi:hypothetical protein
MENQSITNDNLELSDDYKAMIDAMLERDEKSEVKHVSYEDIKDRFLPKK